MRLYRRELYIMTNEGFISMFRRGIKINVIGDSIAAGAGASDSVKSDEEIITTEKRTYCRRYGEKSWYGLFEKYIKDKFPFDNLTYSAIF